MASAQPHIANAVSSSVIRSKPKYAPGIATHHFHSFAAENLEKDAVEEQHINELKEEVRRMLLATVDQNSHNMLDVIDNIQRLGLSRHFGNEIDEILKHAQNGCDTEDDGDLYITALRFRLLRQQGYTVSCDVFNKFKDSNGILFKQSLTSDIVGLLSLYEASHLRFHGEDILDEALTFTMTHLETSIASPRLASSLSKQVARALYQPLWKGFSRIEARHYMSIYEEKDSHSQTLLKLAKLDFNFVQKVHQKELSDITRWWKNLDFANKIPFARDRIVEAYFWAMADICEPKHHVARTMLCKSVALTTTLDDIFDVYGTYEKLERFTEAIERWDISAIDELQLPQCMADCYNGLLETYSEYEEEFAHQGNLYCIEYARESIKILVRGYFQEAKWVKEKHTPTMEEYIPTGIDTAFYPMSMAAFVGMGDVVTKDLMEWMLSLPKIVKATAVIGRLLNDIAGHKFEQSHGQVCKAVTCYMKQYNVDEEEAKSELRIQKEAAWKDLNQELLELSSSSSNVPKPLLQIVLNLARSNEVLYGKMEGYTISETGLKGIIDSLLIEPVQV